MMVVGLCLFSDSDLVFPRAVDAMSWFFIYIVYFLSARSSAGG
jgi:hypothetical protein